MCNASSASAEGPYYEVIDSLEDAMGAIAPRPDQHLAKLETFSPTDLRGS